MNFSHTDLLNGFCYAINVKGSSTVNNRRYGLITRIITQNVSELINIKFLQNTYDTKWKPYHRNKYPLQINMQSLAITATIMLFAEYYIKLISQSNSAVSQVIKNIAFTTYSLYENKNEPIDFEIKYTFKNEEDLLFFFGNRLTGSLRRSNKGTIETLHKILHATKKFKTSFMDDNNTPKEIITHILDMTVSKQKIQESHYKNSSSMSAHIFSKATYNNKIKKSFRRFKKKIKAKQNDTEEKSEETCNINLNNIPAEHVQAIETLINMGYDDDEIYTAYKTLNNNELINKYTNKTNIIELCVSELE
eukprot:106322_1